MSERTPGVRACPIGCGPPGLAIGELPSTSGAKLSRTHYTLAQCGCGKLLYLSPAPTPADLKTMYVDQGQFGSEYTDEARVSAILGYMSEALRSLEQHAGGKPGQPLRVLEVGAGLAWMCRAAKARKRECVTVAQDISPEAANQCPWVDRYVLGDMDDPGLARFAPFDIVSMTHVIEHLVDPVAVIARCRELMSPSGVLFVTAPHRPRGWNDDAPDVHKWKAYSYNHVPAHVQYFSEQSLARLAHAAGCELVYWSHAHEGGEAFEAWLSPRRSVPGLTWVDRATMVLGRKLRRLSRALHFPLGYEGSAFGRPLSSAATACPPHPALSPATWGEGMGLPLPRNGSDEKREGWGEGGIDFEIGSSLRCSHGREISAT